MQRDGSRGVWRLALAAVLVAAAASADPTRVRCGPTQAACGPAIVTAGSVTTTTGGTTTTTILGQLPSWVPSMTAAWMLDEASGSRVNLQGTTSRNLAPTGAVANDTTNKMEGTAAALFGGAGQLLSVSDSGLDAVTMPFSVGCWHRSTLATTAQRAVEHFSGTFGFYLDITNNGFAEFWVADSGGSLHHAWNSLTVTNFNHVVGVLLSPAGNNVTMYINAALGNNDSTASMGAVSAPFVLSSSSTPWTGQLDECFIAPVALSQAAICRICSCGIRGEQCTCTGTAFNVKGRNVTNCNTCTLPADCTATTPP